MTDFSTARRTMIDGQIRTAGVTDRAVLEAMLDIPRERFVPPSQAPFAYLDIDVPVVDRPGQRARRLFKPMVLAKLVQAAEIGPQDLVLDVACATGYSSAVLARLAGHVVALEEDPGLAAQARSILQSLGTTNVSVVDGPLTAGWPARAPYDVILLNGAVEVLPTALKKQLKDGGRLLCVEGQGPASRAMLYRDAHSEVGGIPVFDASGPPIPGFAKPPAFVF